MSKSKDYRWLREDPTEFCLSWAGLLSLLSPSCNFNESNRFWLSSAAGSISSIRAGAATFVLAGRFVDPVFNAPFVFERWACSVNTFHLFSLVFSLASALFCCSVYSWEQSSNSCGLISMNNFMALYTIPCIVLFMSEWLVSSKSTTYLFQWPFEFSYNGANMIGRIISTLSLTRLQKYSLFQKYRARSATWKCGLATDFASWWKRGSWTLANSAGSMTSKISSTSFKNITSFVLLTLGQYRRRPRTTWC